MRTDGSGHVMPVPGYKAPWVPGEVNEAFWREVLVNRAIRDIFFGPDGRLEAFLLDNGEKVNVIKNENGAAVLAIRN